MTRQPAPTEPPVALTVAGSDSGGGAGAQADLATFGARGVFGTSVLTSVTAQNTTGVADTHVLPAETVDAQLSAVAGDFDVGAAKTGMLATATVIETVADHVRDASFPVVVDPVMVAASGDRLLEPAAEDTYEALLAEAVLATPNADEAAVLTGVEVTDGESAREAGRELLALGVDAALVKGGHVPGETVRDVLVTDEGVRTFEHPRVDTDATHGSGCVLSAAIAAELADGVALAEAVERATGFMERAVRYHYDVGEGPGAVHPEVDLRHRAGREATAEAVREVVDALVAAGVRELVPEVGMNVCGAAPFAEDPADTAAVEGRITRTIDGLAPNEGVRFGASSHLSRFLIAAREHEPDLSFAVNCRNTDATREALAELGWPTARYDRADQPDAVREREGRTMAWAAAEAFTDREECPVAVTDPGAVGKEPMCKLVATDAATLRERVLALADAVAE